MPGRSPWLVEIRVDRETDAAMGVSLDKIVERDRVIDLPADAPAAEPAAVLVAPTLRVSVCTSGTWSLDRVPNVLFRTQSPWVPLPRTT